MRDEPLEPLLPAVVACDASLPSPVASMPAGAIPVGLLPLGPWPATHSPSSSNSRAAPRRRAMGSASVSSNKPHADGGDDSGSCAGRGIRRDSTLSTDMGVLVSTSPPIPHALVHND